MVICKWAFVFPNPSDLFRGDAFRQKHLRQNDLKRICPISCLLCALSEARRPTKTGRVFY